MISLSELSRCLQGVVPCAIATSDADGVPNITLASQVHRIDSKHVALSRQFFNKTIRNLLQNPRAMVELLDPLTMQAYRLKLRFLRSETSGPLFDSMYARIEAIASHTGMSGIFRLVASDVFLVESVEKVEGFLTPRAQDEPEIVSVEGLRSEVRGLQLISDRINSADSLHSLLESVLDALEVFFGFKHTMVLLNDDERKRLTLIASHGYRSQNRETEIAHGEGVIGTAALERQVLHIRGLDSELRYLRAIRGQLPHIASEIPHAGLPDAQSVLAIPLGIGQRLVGVLAAEDRDPLGFGEWHEAYLEVIANQIAFGIDRMLDRSIDTQGLPAVAANSAVSPAASMRTLTYYINDDCVFIDDEYLIRNVPGRILWKLMREWKEQGRTEFSNRELRLDEQLGLPPVKDNLESRLVLLRRRLEQKCPDLKIVSTGRGRFALELHATFRLVEK